MKEIIGFSQKFILEIGIKRFTKFLDKNYKIK